MHIETLLNYLYVHGKANFHDNQIVQSFLNQVFTCSKGLTEKQSSLAIKILRKYSTGLSEKIGKDITAFLDNPTYTIPVRVFSSTKQISCIDNPNWGRAFKVKFPYDQDNILMIKRSKMALASHTWSPDDGAWIFSVHEKNILFLSKFIENEEFELDEEFQDYLNQLKKIVENVENFVPMLSLDNGVPKYQNINKYVPELHSKEVISALFEARKAGILTWDDSVSQYLDQTNVHSITLQFLSHEINQSFEISGKDYEIDCLTDIVKNLFPIIFVIPGGSELEKTKMVVNFLSKIGFNNEDISIMFRLSNRDHKEFNDFVKNHNLNNPLTEKTKFMFISTKLPKPLLNSGITFNGIISLGKNHVHYSIRNLVKNQENLIFYSDSSSQGDLNFADL